MGSLHTPFFSKWDLPKVHMGVSYNGGTQQPWVFLLKMTILRCFGGTTIYGNTHIFFNYSRPIPTIWKNWISCPLFISQQNHYTIQGRSFTSQTCAFDSVFHIYMDDWLFVIHKLIISKHMSDYIHLWYIYIYIHTVSSKMEPKNQRSLEANRCCVKKDRVLPPRLVAFLGGADVMGI